MDVGPPGISGFGVLEALRGQGDQTPVIVLTAKDSVDTTLASFDGGADDFMPKPSSFEELLARVKRRIGSPNEAHAESELVHGEVSLDLLTRRVIPAGSQPQALSMTSRQESSRCWSSFFVTLGK